MWRKSLVLRLATQAPNTLSNQTRILWQLTIASLQASDRRKHHEGLYFGAQQL